MCNVACLQFGRSHLTSEDVRNKKVIEVGSRDVNGSLRADIAQFGPSTYLGVDVAAGPGVDEICDITELASRYGLESFDVVISTEVLEHVRDWRAAVSNLKRILRPNGVLLVTTRSKGFPYHGYPYDFWRYEVDDIKAIFSDLAVEVLEKDPVSPGVFVRAHKPTGFSEGNLEEIDLYSIVTHGHTHQVTDIEVYLRRFRHKVRRFLAHLLPKGMLAAIDQAVTGKKHA
jgi:SAM-dependent methyltransferase